MAAKMRMATKKTPEKKSADKKPAAKAAATKPTAAKSAAKKTATPAKASAKAAATPAKKDTGLAEQIESKLIHQFSVRPEDATDETMYYALATVLRERMRGERVAYIDRCKKQKS